VYESSNNKVDNICKYCYIREESNGEYGKEVKLEFLYTEFCHKSMYKIANSVIGHVDYYKCSECGKKDAYLVKHDMWASEYEWLWELI